MDVETGCSYRSDDGGQVVALKKGMASACYMRRLYYDPTSLKNDVKEVMSLVIEGTEMPNQELCKIITRLVSNLEEREAIQFTFLVLYGYIGVVRDAYHGYVNEAIEFMAPVFIPARFRVLLSMVPETGQTKRRLGQWIESVLQPMVLEDYATIYLGCERASKSVLMHIGLCINSVGCSQEALTPKSNAEWESFEFGPDFERVKHDYRQAVNRYTGENKTAFRVVTDDVMRAKFLTWGDFLAASQIVFVLSKPGKAYEQEE